MTWTFQEVVDRVFLGAEKSSDLWLNHLSSQFKIPRNKFLKAGRKDFRIFTDVVTVPIVQGTITGGSVNNDSVSLTVHNEKAPWYALPSEMFSPDNAAENIATMVEKVQDGFGVAATTDVLDDLIGTTIQASHIQTLPAGQEQFFAADDTEQRENIALLAKVMNRVRSNNGGSWKNMWVMMTVDSISNLASYDASVLGMMIQWTPDGMPMWMGKVPIFDSDLATSLWGGTAEATAFVGAGDGYYFDWGNVNMANGGFHTYMDAVDAILFRRCWAEGAGDNDMIGKVMNT